MRLLSEIKPIVLMTRNSYVAIFLGSFAPFHEGHADVIESALLEMHKLDMDVKYFVVCLHNDKSVRRKIKNKKWPVERRIESIKNQQFDFNTKKLILVNNITCYKKAVLDMTRSAVKDLEKIFKIKSNQVVVVLGSDNSNTIKKYIKNHKVVCVVRPGYPVLSSNSKNLILVQRLLKYDISSTNLRKNYVQ